MSKQIILCVTEGKKSEVQFIRNYLAPIYLKEINIKIVSYRANIYELYRELSQDEFLDTYTVLKQRSKDDEEQLLVYDRDDIAEIYLFFDLDAHAPQATNSKTDAPDKVEKMLELFVNETENGKLYLSYPMFEAYKHPIEKSKVVYISINGGYKKYVSEICEKTLEQLSKLSKEQWDFYLITHFKHINKFLYDSYDLQEKYFAENFNQPRIYQDQLKRYIKPNKQVYVISPFVLFLLDYLGDNLLHHLKLSTQP